MSFFKDLNVTYWTNSLYNDGQADKEAIMDQSFDVPLIDNARNYVCAIERMEISSNAISYYDVQQDEDAELNDAFPAGTYNTRIFLIQNSTDETNALASWTLTGRYYSIQDLITSLNELGAVGTILDAFPNYNDGIGTWNLDSGGCITFSILPSQVTLGVNFTNCCFKFSSSQLASLFGLPATPASSVDYGPTYAQYDPSDLWLRFKTKYSRIDGGDIPSSIVVRTNLPFESDQVNTAKTNIATDFSISVGSTVSTNYNLERREYESSRGNLEPYDPTIASFSWSFGMGGIIIYNPNERRWLNFSAPTPITHIRIWVEYVTNNGTLGKIVKLPNGCKFSIKLGLYLKEP